MRAMLGELCGGGAFQIVRLAYEKASQLEGYGASEKLKQGHRGGGWRAAWRVRLEENGEMGRSSGPPSETCHDFQSNGKLL